MCYITRYDQQNKGKEQMNKQEFLQDVNNTLRININAAALGYKYKDTTKGQDITQCVGEATLTYRGRLKTYIDDPKHAISTQFIEDYHKGFWTKFHTAIEIANWYIQNGIENNRPIDQMKMHKITYYAHAWWLGMGNGNLFDDEIQAWDYGPVITSLYPIFSDYGKTPITTTSYNLRRSKTALFDEGTEHHLKEIWKIYKNKSSITLMHMTHEKGEPWRHVYEKNNRKLSDKPKIPNILIEKIYKQFVKELNDER